MGFLRRLFGSKKQTNGSPTSNKPVKDNNKKRWNFSKHTNTNTNRDNSVPPPPSSTALTLNHSHPSSSLDASKHAIAVAAATAAVAEAALAAAHAAAEVVRLTSSNNNKNNASSSRPATAPVHVSRRSLPEEIAAVKLQSAFRGYLARRALRALKALVKLQALVRGHIVRKQTADMLRRMQTLVRLQVQARATRVHSSDNMFKSSLSHYPVPEEYEHPFRAYSTKFDGSSILKRCSSNANFRNINSERARFDSNWLDHWMEDNVCSQRGNTSLKNLHPGDENSDKILEVDTWRPHFKSHHGGSSSSSFQTSQHYYSSSDYNNNKNFMAYESSPSKRLTNRAFNQNLSSREGLKLSSLKFPKVKEEEEANSRTTDNSPQAFSASSRHGSGARRGGTFTPTRSECSWGYFSGYAGYPNYMANTESSRAKVRSQSAPRQRLEFDRYGSTKGFVQSLWDVGPNNSDKDSDLLRNTSRFNRIGSSTNFR
ncbi:hypothetical protein RIF29_23711 [Crotalaria pallida]|uniref:DUF4005 domain-containing protein n=1 Tax=Crotalaria pallida TaxID=3830 RepID=A0AAN9FAG4_CROPI